MIPPCNLHKLAAGTLTSLLCDLQQHQQQQQQQMKVSALPLHAFVCMWQNVPQISSCMPLHLREALVPVFFPILLTELLGF